MSSRKINRLQKRIEERSLWMQDREEEYRALCDRLRTDLDPVNRVKEERSAKQLEAQIDGLEEEIDRLEKELRELQAEGGDCKVQHYSSPVKELLTILQASGLVLKDDLVQQSFDWVVGTAGYSGEIPQGLARTLSTLADLPGDTEYGERDAALVKWLAFLLVQDRLDWPGEIREKLMRWGRERLPELDRKIEALKQKQERSLPRSQRQSALLIWVRASRNNAQRYQVSASVVSDLSQYQPQEWTGIEPLEHLPNHEPDFTAEELPELVKYYFQQCQRLPLGELSLEVFLPMDLLNLTLNRWSCPLFGQEISLVCYRPVNLRSSERLTPDYGFLWRKWHDRWRQVEDQGQTPAHSLFKPGDPRNLHVQVADCQVVAVHISEKPDPSVFGCLLSHAVPVFLWMRENLAILPYQRSQVEEVLKCVMQEIPNSVLRKRQETQQPDFKDPGSHIGHHLALLWENPRVVPPNPEFEYPLP